MTLSIIKENKQMLNNPFEQELGKQYEKATFGIPHYNLFHRILITKIREYISKRESIMILDIGSGTGNLASGLIQIGLQNYKYIGVDSSKRMHSLSRNRFKGNSKIKLHHRDALDFLQNQDDRCFDIIINSWTFHNWHYEYRSRALDEVFLKLKPGGLFLNADKLAHPCSDTHRKNLNWQIKYAEDIFRTDQLLLKEWSRHYYQDEHPERLFKEDYFLKKLSDIGFYDIQVVKRERMDVLVLTTKPT